MYDSIDGKKASILKNVGSIASDSIYLHNGSVTISNNQPWQYVEAPEFVEPIIMNTPRYSPPINPDYLKLAQIAYDTVLQTMLEGEKEHGADSWKNVNIDAHIEHALGHLEDYINKASFGIITPEDHIAHTMTRCAMIKYLEENKQREELQNEV
jgi:hypothetical protein